MSCKHAAMYKSKNFIKSVPVCKKDKHYCRKVKLIPSVKGISFEFTDTFCDIEFK